MPLSIYNHWLSAAEHIVSPNCNDRPNDRIDLLVIHNISLPPGEFGGPYISQLFTNQLDPKTHPYFEEIAGLEVSAHVLIRRDGAMVQYVPFNKRAWHAGKSCFQGEENCNDFSIGIELEGVDDMPYESIQYQQLAEVSQLLLGCYIGLSAERISGHCDIAPGRKTDPGESFDWNYYRRLL
ncbi:MAG: 1,6-anhydro-N-acetylmuramyl-L-alanine amidase AmpD [Pseudomonadales bacterium]